MDESANLDTPTQRQRPPDVSLTPVSQSLLALRPASAGNTPDDSLLGQQIGRYLIESLLGRGGFGAVYLARDTELNRRVAVKVPHLHRMRNDRDRRMFLTEARMLALLDHPAIVPVYDFGVIPDGRCFVVSKFIEGRDLARLLALERPSPARTADILSVIADALHHIHLSRLVHRDIKPSNLLVGDDGRVYVADFGLAMPESMLDAGVDIAGTPNYMSPEQARGEGHLMDGRSDQFSLGCVMYELLTGERPFAGSHTRETIELLLNHDPAPPRERNSAVPQELNRICLKLLSKRAADRYARTSQLADDLRHWIRTAHEQVSDTLVTESMNAVDELSGEPRVAVVKRGLVVPRGLRSFSRDDAYFFLRLLPGAIDRDGLPASLRHWRQWVESDEESPELKRLGVIAGPTGSGKSSLVRAGLLPRLDARVASLVVEASPEGIERQLVAAIDRVCSEPLEGTLAEQLGAIRLGRGLAPDRSLLIVIDQFEQWLNVCPDPANTDLVRGLRQCDGQRVRCLILVRDDFWLALNRFLEAVDCVLTLGHNALMVDLFDREHARRVLIEFGRGYGRLPPDTAPLTRDQERFLDESLANLAIDGKYTPVHLALFADLVRSRDWSPTTLRQLGGTTGVGEQFLHESFSASWAPVNQRAHEQAARRILAALLPRSDSDLKASGRTRAELLAASGYDKEPRHFEALMQILERDLRLISATESLDRTRSSSSLSTLEHVSYQLSHDFLVPSVRAWLSASRRASFRGRLSERITEQARLWGQRRDPRFLPNMLDWSLARLLLRGSQMPQLERAMLAARDRRSLLSISLVLAIGLVSIWGFREYRLRTKAEALVEQLRTSDLVQVPAIIDRLTPLKHLAAPEIEARLPLVARGSTPWVALQMTAVRWNLRGADELFKATLDAPPENLEVKRAALAPHAESLIPRCWELLDNPTSSAAERHAFRAAQLLALFDPPDDPPSRARWQKQSQFVADQLVQSCRLEPAQFAILAASLEPAAPLLVEPLTRHLGAEESVETQFATALLAQYLDKDLRARTRLALSAAPWQFKTLLPPSLVPDQDVLWSAVREVPSENLSSAERILAARRRALAAALLLSRPESASAEELWQLFRRAPQPETRTAVIHLCAAREVPWAVLASRLRRESDPGVVSALLLAIGEYPQLSPVDRVSLAPLVEDLFQRDPDPGVHAAAEWLLRRWQSWDSTDPTSLAATSGTPRPPTAQPIASIAPPSDESPVTPAQRLPVADAQELRAGPRAPRAWLHTPHGHTLVVLSAELPMQPRHRYLLASKEVTVEQYWRFRREKYINRDYSRTLDSPANAVTWLEALAYCNWLSQEEGIPESEWCYPTDQSTWANWEPTPEHALRRGYRLPLRAEWEHACRAGTTTERYLGDDLVMLANYARYEVNGIVRDPQTGREISTTGPVGLLKPNDFGFFDMYGNVGEWCSEAAGNQRAERQFCGSGIAQRGVAIKSTETGSYPPTIVFNSLGFRIARTLPDD